ncbi:hypothetical protein RDWZM_007606 [Blomia tropicalis]|uniref:Uncharacterized protein n=1 Tax=Blomia tropicalis TaxID=40697 RepID=A0A9Q0LZS4_BLOTA|nr:hypothetical protein RDWZM_007606 [Blomia tropicalis]
MVISTNMNQHQIGVQCNRHSPPNSTTSVQCTIADLFLCRLPGHVRIESVDFENSILQCVKNSLHSRDESECNLTREMIRDITTVQSSTSTSSLDEIVSVDESSSLPSSSTSTSTSTSSSSSSSSLIQHSCVSSTSRYFVVCIEPSRLLWTSTETMTTTETIEFDLHRHANVFMQTCFNEILLCYVNIQLPNMIIWLLSSIPHKIVRNDSLATTTTTTRCDTSSSSSALSTNISDRRNRSLFVLAWHCHQENDVVRLRQTYKHIRTLDSIRHRSIEFGNKLVSHKRHADSDLIIKSSVKSVNTAKGRKASTTTTTTTVVESSSQSTSLSTIGKIGHHHILSRQRHPAKLIHETSTIYSTGSPHMDRNCEKNHINLSQKNHQKSSMHSAYTAPSESEFDTTQINSYLSHGGKVTSLCKVGKNNRTRSRSVDSPRHRFRVLYKPICDDIELSSYNLHKFDTSTIECVDKLRDNTKRSTTTTITKSFLDALNSEGSSISDESSSGEYEYKNGTNGTKTNPTVIKSVLKKSTNYSDYGHRTVRASSSSISNGNGGFFHSNLLNINDRSKDQHRIGGGGGSGGMNGRQCGNYNKKNVTFSAYATIQMVDN